MCTMNVSAIAHTIFCITDTSWIVLFLRYYVCFDEYYCIDHVCVCVVCVCACVHACVHFLPQHVCSHPVSQPPEMIRDGNITHLQTLTNYNIMAIQVYMYVCKHNDIRQERIKGRSLQLRRTTFFIDPQPYKRIGCAKYGQNTCKLKSQMLRRKSRRSSTLLPFMRSCMRTYVHTSNP